ncbi:MAG TPA: hypothetical protein VIK89_11045 [Cytophagaceae bacterium]
MKKTTKPGLPLRKFGLIFLGLTVVVTLVTSVFPKAGVYRNKLLIKRERLVEQALSFPSNDTLRFTREEIVKRQKEKIQKGEPLVIHVFVPLCDNEYQGIVPVNEKLGDGRNLITNLYWGAAYGIKTFFKNKTDWKLLVSQKNVNEHILERVIFNKKFNNGADVYLVADAYSGDKMKECLEAFFTAMMGGAVHKAICNGKEIGFSGKADFLIFNGHNGLMDTRIDLDLKPSTIKDAAVIACMSGSYFKDKLSSSGGYPLVTTTNYMAPEGYVLERIVNAWAEMKTPEQIRLEAGAGYNTYQKCGINGAARLFSTGW